MYNQIEQSINNVQFQHNGIVFRGCVLGVKQVLEQVHDYLSSVRGHYTNK